MHDNDLRAWVYAYFEKHHPELDTDKETAIFFHDYLVKYNRCRYRMSIALPQNDEWQKVLRYLEEVAPC